MECAGPTGGGQPWTLGGKRGSTCALVCFGIDHRRLTGGQLCAARKRGQPRALGGGQPQPGELHPARRGWAGLRHRPGRQQDDRRRFVHPGAADRRRTQHRPQPDLCLRRHHRGDRPQLRPQHGWRRLLVGGNARWACHRRRHIQQHKRSPLAKGGEAQLVQWAADHRLHRPRRRPGQGHGPPQRQALHRRRFQPCQQHRAQPARRGGRHNWGLGHQLQHPGHPVTGRGLESERLRHGSRSGGDQADDHRQLHQCWRSIPLAGCHDQPHHDTGKRGQLADRAVRHIGALRRGVRHLHARRGLLPRRELLRHRHHRRLSRRPALRHRNPLGVQRHGKQSAAHLGGLHGRRHALQRRHHRHRRLRRRPPALVEQPLRRRPGRPRLG